MNMNLFVVESPLQLLNAGEARQFYGISPEQAFLVVLRGVSEKNQQQTLELMDAGDWADVKVMGATRRLADFARAQKSIDSWLNRGGPMSSPMNKPVNRPISRPVNKIFIGDYRARFMRHLANGYAEEVVLLDDGTATLGVAKQRLDLSPVTDKYQSGWRKYINKRRLLGYQDQDIKTLTYFTAFDVEAANSDNVQSHHYRFLRRKLGRYERDGHCLFVGSPMVEIGMVSETAYRGYLKTIAELSDGPIYYVPHRREAPDKVRRYASALDWKVQDFDRPIELALIGAHTLPQCLLGLFSTALNNVALLFGESLMIKSFEIPEEHILIEERKKNLRHIYQYYRDHYLGEAFELIPLSEEK